MDRQETFFFKINHIIYPPSIISCVNYLALHRHTFQAGWNFTFNHVCQFLITFISFIHPVFLT